MHTEEDRKKEVPIPLLLQPQAVSCFRQAEKVSLGFEPERQDYAYYNERQCALC